MKTRSPYLTAAYLGRIAIATLPEPFTVLDLCRAVDQANAARAASAGEMAKPLSVENAAQLLRYLMSHGQLRRVFHGHRSGGRPTTYERTVKYEVPPDPVSLLAQAEIAHRLRAEEKLTYREIADRMQVSPGYVAHLLYRYKRSHAAALSPDDDTVSVPTPHELAWREFKASLEIKSISSWADLPTPLDR
jgi:DNA-binding CsgD family transcriptional regulator